MAKRTTPRSPSQADDAAGAEAAPRPRGRQSRAAGSGPTGHSLAAEIASSEAAAVDPIGPSDEDIRLRAYHRFLERGSSHGLDFDDWLQAERELRIKK